MGQIILEIPISNLHRLTKDLMEVNPPLLAIQPVEVKEE